MAGINEDLTFKAVRVAVLTVSDTRSAETDTSGDALVAYLEGDGHQLADRALVKDDVEALAACLRGWIERPDVDVVVSTGGSGITGRDVTPEAFALVLEIDIPGFGELFRMLSYETIGTSTMQSRACAGVAKGTYLFALPGSRGAVKDGWTKILRYQLDSRHEPCNLVELMPRLQER